MCFIWKQWHVTSYYISLTSRDATAENTNFVEGRLGVDLREATNMDDGVLAEGGGPDEVENRLRVECEARLPIADHHATIHVDPEEITKVALL